MLAIGLALLVVLTVPRGRVLAESKETQESSENKSKPKAAIQDAKPLSGFEVESDQSPIVLSDTPLDAANYVPTRARWEIRQTGFEAPAFNLPPQPANDIPAPTNELPPPTNTGTQPTTPTSKDPCAAAQFKPLCELGIGIAQPAGQTPTDFATPCWNQINAGPSAAYRCWAELLYQWDATCLCHRPLYFEEINAERYGYVCDCCLQPFASAAHFFGKVPALPYLMVAECPGECIYTLGHYRPGSSPPWRWHWPPCDPLAAVAAGGIYTGLIFAIP
jgi:hypothetical protein